MEVEGADHGSNDVNFTKKTIVKATGRVPKPHILTLSKFELLSCHFPATYFYIYGNPLIANFASIVNALIISLTKTVRHSYPFAGQIVPNPSTSEPEIISDNTGALVVEAHANIALQELNYNLNQSVEGILVSINHDFPLQIQVTCYPCGGILITFPSDHALGDASAFGKFLVTWSEIATNNDISSVSDHRRYLRARVPPIMILRWTNLSSPVPWKNQHAIDGSKRTQIKAFAARWVD